MNWAKRISIIIPIATGDESWRGLISDLKTIKNYSEIILCGPEVIDFPKDWQELPNVRFLRASGGRAKQMNVAAAKANREVLWFLHSDSKFTSSTLASLKVLFKTKLSGVYFFNLGFFDGPPLMAVNSLGVWFRSHCLKLPFGDQGFLMEKKLFEKLGGFPEDTPYGEDHLLIWKAHEMGSPVTPIPAKLLTSARKYTQGGWWSTTRNHLFLTFMQGKQELRRIVRAKKGGL